MKRRASFHNLGCKVNAYETEAMEQLLESGGYEIVPFGEEAEVCIINTCSVTNIADRKSRQMLHRARAKNPGAVIVAAGCYVQAAAEVLRRCCRGYPYREQPEKRSVKDFGGLFPEPGKRRQLCFGYQPDKGV